MRLLEIIYDIAVDKLILESEFNFIEEDKRPDVPTEDIMTTLSNLLKENNGDDVYISFRDSITTNLINPTNIYRTPTGFYCYPLGPILKEKLKISDWDDLKKMSKDDFFKSRIFPWRSESEYLYIFHINNNSRLLYTSKDNTDKISKYVNKIKSHYQDNDEIVDVCQNFLDKGFVKSTRYGQKYTGIQGFWMLIFEVGLLSKTKYSLNYFFTILCWRINLDGFIDDAGNGMIHPNEPYNAVLFKLRSIADYYNIISKTKGDRFALPRSSDIIGSRYGKKKFKYQKSDSISRI